MAAKNLVGCRQPLVAFVITISLAGRSSLLPAQADVRAPNAAGEPNPFDLSEWLDSRYSAIWSESGITPELCDDATYQRRVTLDLIGRIPSIAEVRVFLADESPEKRARLVDKLLNDADESAKNSELAAEHLSRIWRRLIIAPPGAGNVSLASLDPWLKSSFRENRPYNEMIRALVVASQPGGSETAFYQSIGNTPEAAATEISRAFLGVRIGCAQCHDHPFTDWKQTDFWGMAAFFAGTQLQPGNDNASQVGSNAPGRITHEGRSYPAKVLGVDAPTEIGSGQTPREVLAEWMTSAENPTFAANAVNRVWQHLLGRGLVPEVDDLDLASPEERAPVLDDLAQNFIESGYDLRWLISGICKSKVYQCVSLSDEPYGASFASGTRPLKTLTPEQVFDSLEQALMLPVSRSNTESARHNGQMVQIVTRLDESISLTPEEYSAGVPQTLMLMNGVLISTATDLRKSRTLRAIVDAPFIQTEDRLDALYLATVTRLPRDGERTHLMPYLSNVSEPHEQREALGHIFWALLNSPEFVLCP